MQRRLSILLATLVLTACGGGGGGDIPTTDSPRGPWDGTWLLSTTPPSGGFTATCTGPFPPSRYPLYDSLGTPVVCGLTALEVRQSETTLTIEPETVLCGALTPPATVTVSGSGQIDGGDTGSSGQLTRQVAFADGSRWSASYLLVRSGAAVTLYYRESTADGGTCTITPMAAWSATIAP